MLLQCGSSSSKSCFCCLYYIFYVIWDSSVCVCVCVCVCVSVWCVFVCCVVVWWLLVCVCVFLCVCLCVCVRESVCSVRLLPVGSVSVCLRSEEHTSELQPHLNL